MKIKYLKEAIFNPVEDFDEDIISTDSVIDSIIRKTANSIRIDICDILEIYIPQFKYLINSHSYSDIVSYQYNENSNTLEFTVNLDIKDQYYNRIDFYTTYIKHYIFEHFADLVYRLKSKHKIDIIIFLKGWNTIELNYDENDALTRHYLQNPNQLIPTTWTDVIKIGIPFDNSTSDEHDLFSQKDTLLKICNRSFSDLTQIIEFVDLIRNTTQNNNFVFGFIGFEYCGFIKNDLKVKDMIDLHRFLETSCCTSARFIYCKLN